MILISAFYFTYLFTIFNLFVFGLNMQCIMLQYELTFYVNCCKILLVFSYVMWKKIFLSQVLWNVLHFIILFLYVRNTKFIFTTGGKQK